MPALIDLSGSRCGRLVVEGRAPDHRSPGGRATAMWRCRCDCGEIRSIRSQRIATLGAKASCGCLQREQARARRFKDRVGHRYGRLTVLRQDGWYTPPSPKNRRCARWVCRCDCGADVTVSGTNLAGGNVRSCGCLSREAAARNGEARRLPGPTRTTAGYLTIFAPDHPRATTSGRVLEHIDVMEASLGRLLLPGETVHHVNGVKDDNRPENLELWVSWQPSGQRPADLVDWATEVLRRYQPSALASTALTKGIQP